jgi:lipopolysaccharide export system protein LptA
MRNRVERLRIWLVGSAVFLVLTIAVFIGSARYLRHLHLKLPGKLGLNITSENDYVTSSHTSQNGTVYVIRASKQIEYSDGKVILHDASISLRGPKQNRSDCIYGDQFEYDHNSGLVRALGVVHIDLQSASVAGGQAPCGRMDSPSPAAARGSASAAKVLHVTTSGLVYMEKLGVAATSQYIEFQIDGLSGHATGADYNSDSGMLMLHSAVTMSGIAGKRPVVMNASTASLDSHNHESYLTHAQYASLGRTVDADQATLYSRPDGTLARVLARGNVTSKDKGVTVVAQRADVGLTAAGQAHSALLTGGVHYSSDQPLRQATGQADEATIAFDDQAQPQPQHAVFTGAVHMTERTRSAQAPRDPWNTRDLTAAKYEASLVPAGEGRSQLRDAEATGSAHLTEVSPVQGNNRSQNTTELLGDDLKAHLIDTGDAKRPPPLDTLAARGHTVLRQVNADGIEQTSAGDTLDAKFRQKPASSGTKVLPAASITGAAVGPQHSAPDLLLSAVQQGHIKMTRIAPVKSAAKAGAKANVETGVAERAVYDGDLDRETLTGNVALTDEGSELWANQVVLERASGDAHALGKVRVDYVQEQSPQPVAGRQVASAGAGRGGQQRSQDEPSHVMADRADLEHATGIATFYGKPVRMWNSASQVQAPVIELARAQKRMIARGDGSTGWSSAVQSPQVHTVLVSTSSDATASDAGKEGAGKDDAANSGSGTSGCATGQTAKTGGGKSSTAERTPSVVRIASGGLIYSRILDQADFTGGFRADTVDGTIRANEATAYLRQGASGLPGSVAKSAASGSSLVGGNVAAGGGEGPIPALNGSLERMIATGHVDIAQPGLHATGERLVYTADDRVSLLTGDAKNPPNAVDARGTTTTGVALRFRDSCDDSGGATVEALGSLPGIPSQRVRTDSRVTSDAKKEKGK